MSSHLSGVKEFHRRVAAYEDTRRLKEEIRRSHREQEARTEREKPRHVKLYERARAFIRRTRYDKSLNPGDLVWTIDVYIAYAKGEGKVLKRAVVKDGGLTAYLLAVLRGWAVEMNIYPVHLRFLPPHVPPVVRMYLFRVLVGGDLKEPWPMWQSDHRMWEDPTAEVLYQTLWAGPYEAYYEKQMRRKRAEERQQRAKDQRDFDARMSNRWYGDRLCIECNYAHRRESKQWVEVCDEDGCLMNVSAAAMHFRVTMC